MKVNIGDKVCQLVLYGTVISEKSIVAINPKTISVAEIREFEGRSIELWKDPKQDPSNWRVAVPSTIDEIRNLSQEIQERQKRLCKLYRSLPVAEI